MDMSQHNEWAQASDDSPKSAPFAEPGAENPPSLEEPQPGLIADPKSATRCGFGGDASNVLAPIRRESELGATASVDGQVAAMLARIEAGHKKVQTAFAKSVFIARQVGDDLAELKELVGHGEWEAFLDGIKTAIGVSPRTALLYIRIAKHWELIVDSQRRQPLCEMSLRSVDRLLSKSLPKPLSARELLTPRQIIDAALETFGSDGITLDPAAEMSPQNVFNIPAELHYTETVDGLDPKNDWMGSVFLSPPHDATALDQWIGRLAHEVNGRHVGEGIVLVPADTDAPYFSKLVALSASIVFVAGRIQFVGQKKAASFPSLIAYVGERHGEFGGAFRKFGELLRPA